jgi:hypothetical protein
VLIGRYTQDDEGDLAGIDADDHVVTWKSRSRTARGMST